MNSYEKMMTAIQSDHTMAQLMEQMGVTDPQLKMMAEIMSRQNEVDKPDGDMNVKNALFDNTGELIDEINFLQEENVQLREDNEQLAENLDKLAAALGCCPNCLGEDKRCEECRGTGISGSCLPDKRSFQTYVVPAIKRIKEVKRKARIKTPQ